MQVNTLKLNNKRKSRKNLGRGGKKGTYSGRGVKGQKARSGVSINPLFEGGRSSLIDRMKKNRGFKSTNSKKIVIKLSDLEKKFKDGDIVNVGSLISSGLVDKIRAREGIKILATGKITKKLIVGDGIFMSAEAMKFLKKDKKAPTAKEKKK